MKNLPSFSVRRPITVYMFTSVLVLLGAISFMRLPVDLMPEIQNPTLTVRTAYPGVAPEEVENLVTRPLEASLSSAPGIYRISSNSSEGSSNIRVSFDWSVNIDEAANEVRTRVDRMRGALPDDVEPPTIFKFDTTQFPIMFLAVSGDKDPRELRTLLEKDIQPRLERLPGVAAVDIRGGLRRQIHVKPSIEKLRSYNLSVGQITNILRQENQNRPVGPMDEGKYEVLVRSQGEFDNVEEVRNVVVASRNGAPIFLKDVAEVQDAHEEIRQLVRIDDKPGIRFSIRKQSGANTVTVAARVRDEIERLQKAFPGTTIRAMMDSSIFITRAIDNLRESAISGGILAILALLLFLRNIRSTLIVAASIPITVIGTFLLMYASGFTLNTMSFGALALGVGMIVDNAIVIIENVFRHREGGMTHAEAAVFGTSEVTAPLIASTLTSVAVFLPLVFLGGMSGIMFKQLAYIVGFSQIFALIIGLTLVPVLCAKYLRVRPPDAKRHPWMAKIIKVSGSALDGLDDRYQRGIRWSLNHRKTVVFSAVLLFAGAICLIPFIGVEMMPEADENELRVNLELPAGTKIEITSELAGRMESIIKREVPEMERILVEVGGGGFMSGSSTHTAEFTVQLKSKSERKRSSQEMVNALRPKLNLQPGMMVRVRASSNNSMMRRMGPGQNVGERVSVEIRGHDMQVASDLAKRIKDIVESVPGITDAQVSRREGMPEMLVTVDRSKAASLGVNASDIATTLETVVGGNRASQFREEGQEYDILVRLSEEQRASLGNLQNVTVLTPSGQAVPIGDLVKMQRREGPVSIERQDQERLVQVTAGYANRDLGSIMRDIDRQLSGMNMPTGFSLNYGGEFEEQQKSFRELLFSLILAIVLVYMVMASEFESLRDPLIILFSIPLAAIGVCLSLFLTETTFNMQAFIGVILLAGIAVNNAIVLIDYTILLRERDKLLLKHAVELAGRRRLRPILMTTLTAILGLVPMSLGFGEGAEVQAPMARVVIGGMLTSTFITLFFIPTIYTMIEERGLREEATAKDLGVEGAPQPLEPLGAD
ncbi:MAG TPA: efflux RND transporter permease subunit [Blastocatellia bacterium]|nr:efflux RND transporter permease subunit [Blastocatellia bacterium]